MVADTQWCELCRFEDQTLARAVATTIAAMEFEVRLVSAEAPFVVEVTGPHRSDLADVLEEIIDEQLEFDRMLVQRAANRAAGTQTVVVVVLTGTVDLLLLLGLLEL